MKSFDWILFVENSRKSANYKSSQGPNFFSFLEKARLTSKSQRPSNCKWLPSHPICQLIFGWFFNPACFLAWSTTKGTGARGHRISQTQRTEIEVKSEVSHRNVAVRKRIVTRKTTMFGRNKSADETIVSPLAINETNSQTPADMKRIDRLFSRHFGNSVIEACHWLTLSWRKVNHVKSNSSRVRWGEVAVAMPSSGDGIQRSMNGHILFIPRLNSDIYDWTDRTRDKRPTSELPLSLVSHNSAPARSSAVECSNGRLHTTIFSQ